MFVQLAVVEQLNLLISLSGKIRKFISINIDSIFNEHTLHLKVIEYLGKP